MLILLELNRFSIQLDVVPVDETDVEIRASSAKVFVNGSILGYCALPQKLVDEIRTKT